MTAKAIPGDGECREIEAIVERLFAPLSDDQREIVNATGDAFFRAEQVWPTFQHVEAILDLRGLNAKTTLMSFPVFQPSIAYGAFTSLSWVANLHDDTQLQLTLLGLHHYTGVFRGQAEALVRDILRMLAVFVDARRSFTPPPTEVAYLRLTSDEVRTKLRSTPHNIPSAQVLNSFVQAEPPFNTALGGSGIDASGMCTWTVQRQLVHYADVGLDLHEYVRRMITKFYKPPVSTQARVVSSPLSLPVSFGYLDTAWRVAIGTKEHLVVLPSPERAAAIAFDAGTREEYLERISALGDVLKSLNVPAGGAQKGGHALERLRAYLTAKLSPESHGRVADALDRLGQVREIRNGGGHAEAEPAALRAYRSLGVPVPITDWGRAWSTVRDVTIEALDAIRDELLGLADSPPRD
jgi:hypothetical protein